MEKEAEDVELTDEELAGVAGGDYINPTSSTEQLLLSLSEHLQTKP